VIVSGVVDELAVSDVHAGVGDVSGVIAEKEEVAGLQIFAIDRSDAGPCSLQVRIARHDDTPLAHEHLREAGTIEAEIRRATPGVSDAEESPGGGDGLIDGKGRKIAGDIAGLDEGRGAVDELDFEPAIAVAYFAGDHFEASFPRNGKERGMLGDVRFAIEIGGKLRDTNDGAIRGVGLIDPLAQVGTANPARVIVTGANLNPMPLRFQFGDVGAVERLRNNIGMIAGLAVHVSDGFEDGVIGFGSGVGGGVLLREIRRGEEGGGEEEKYQEFRDCAPTELVRIHTVILKQRRDLVKGGSEAKIREL